MKLTRGLCMIGGWHGYIWQGLVFYGKRGFDLKYRKDGAYMVIDIDELRSLLSLL